MSSIVFVVNGQPRAGKDTLVRFMGDALGTAGYAVTHFSSIDPIKSIVSEGLGIDISKKTEADRYLLASIGALVEEHSSFRSNICLDVVRSVIKQLEGKSVGIFLQIREPHIIDKVREELLKDKIPTYRILVTSPRAQEVISNSADAGVAGTAFDYLVKNNGTLGKLYDEAKALVDLATLRKEYRHAS